MIDLTFSITDNFFQKLYNCVRLTRVKIYGVGIVKFGMTPVKYNLIVYFGGFVVCRYLLN